MFKDFETTKKQLAELSEIVNKFKSEAVQLRLLELLFNASPPEIDPPAAATEKPKRKTRAKRRASAGASAKGPSAPTGESKATKKTATFGPGTVLNKLYDDGFFSSAKTISDICQHADANLARKIKPNEISGKLARMVRNGELAREKNSENQYAYTKP